MDKDAEKILIHDLRNPLAAIIGSAELFNDGLLGDLTAEQRDQIRIIRTAGRMLSDIISDLQDIRGLEDGDLKPVLADVPVSDLLKELKWTGDFAEKEGKKLEINTGRTERVLADKGILARVLSALIINALKQESSGDKTLLRIDEDKEFVKISIVGSGDGVPGELVPKLFDKNFKTENPGLKTKAGPGLGFYFCKLAVLAHGGKIEAESGRGKGLTVTIHLPKQRK